MQMKAFCLQIMLFHHHPKGNCCHTHHTFLISFMGMENFQIPRYRPQAIWPQIASQVSSHDDKAGLASDHLVSVGSTQSTCRSLPSEPPLHSDPSQRDVITSHAKHLTDVNADPTSAKFTISPSMPSPANLKIDNLTGSRIFLDICCGVNSPLSTAVQSLNGDVMRCEYSRLNLLPNGPPALRTPTHLDGIPGISGQELLRVQESSTMLLRSVQCLQVVVSSGGHGHLEQPKTAMSWSEPAVQQFISQQSCSCISMAACGFGRDWHKHWLFASTFHALAKMAYSCPHPYGSINRSRGLRPVQVIT